ncbi:MAG: hypothetical protein LW710_09500 [Burkholderiales bacterium]|uniref:hypothetical protein n=1 Tax=Limnobacter sp. TaxID=2003368 RepID=UPI0039BC9A0B|nr:hypothetical protein [Burkholderiales bacterium]
MKIQLPSFSRPRFSPAESNDLRPSPTPPVVARSALRSRGSETPARIAYPFSARPEGYADLEVTDFATQAAAALKPVTSQITQESQCSIQAPGP